MDNTTIISTLQGRISILTGQISALQQELDTDNALLILAQNGYQSDQDAIKAGIVAGLQPVNTAVSTVLAANTPVAASPAI